MSTLNPLKFPRENWKLRDMMQQESETLGSQLRAEAGNTQFRTAVPALTAHEQHVSYFKKILLNTCHPS